MGSGMMGLGISYGNEFTNMSGKYAMLTFIGMQFTGALIVKLAGFLMATLSYQRLLYACLGLAFVQLIGFVGMTKIGESFQQEKNRVSEDTDEQSSLKSN